MSDVNRPKTREEIENARFWRAIADIFYDAAKNVHRTDPKKGDRTPQPPAVDKEK